MSNAAQPTKAILIHKVRDPDDDSAWQEFVRIYRPLIVGYCRNRGLQEADAFDVAQEVLRSVAGALPRFEYDPERGRFRGWLLTATRRKLDTFLARRMREHQVRNAESVIASLPAPAGPDPWDDLYQRRMFEWAAEQVRPTCEETTWKAFWMTAVEERSPRDVAETLGLSVGTVYADKSRILAKLRGCIQSAEGDCVSDF